MCYNVFLNGFNVPNSDCNIHYLDRSFPSHKMFIEGTSEGKEGRATLFRVLAVYAMYNPQVSYCQGKPQPVVHFWANAIYYWYLSYCQGKLWPIFPFGKMLLANRCLFYLLILVSNKFFFPIDNFHRHVLHCRNVSYEHGWGGRFIWCLTLLSITSLLKIII